MDLQKSDDNSEPIASWFDNISLDDFLGSGSFGFVFKAVSGPATLSAVKIIFLDASGNSPQELEDERDRISREYQLMHGKDHANVCKILKSTFTPFTLEHFENIKNLNCLAENGDALDFIQLQCIRASRRGPIPTFCIQMELCGKTLRQWLNAQSVENPELLQIQTKIIAGLARGLKYLHDNNIMHRDFRPENIMFSHSPNPEEFVLPIKIGDFGLCRRVHSEQTKTRTLTPGVGHDFYRAPEAVGTDYGFQADLFSLGLVIFEVIQLINQKDICTTFYKLVHASQTHLVKRHSQWLPNMKEIIISLTKIRVQDRIKDIPASLVHGFTTVETADQLTIALGNCRPGDVIEIGAGFHGGYFILDTDNIKITGTGESCEAFLSLYVKANHCIIKKLQIDSLEIMGNDNWVTNVKCHKLDIKGNNNKMSNCFILENSSHKQLFNIKGSENALQDCVLEQPIFEQGSGNIFLSISIEATHHAGLIISGSDNTVHSCTLKTNLENGADLSVLNREDPQLDKVLGEIGIKELYKNMGQLGLILTPDSSECSITDSSFKNAIVCGSQHKLTNITLQNTILFRGSGHSIEACKGLKLQDESLDNNIIKNEFVESA